MIEVQSPDPIPPMRIKSAIPNSVFLAGSIEMGNAENWQELVIKALSKHEGFILNPRRSYWDSSIEQNIKSPQFYEQVSWELTALDNSEIVAMYLDPNTKSPISLLELGLYANTNKMIVCCPDGFWRKGNVDIVCERFNIIRTSNMKDFIGKIMAKLRY